MDHLWSPWRYTYIRQSHAPGECLFCRVSSENADIDNLIVFRSTKNFVILNRYPYTNGHLMVVPYRHSGDISDLSEEELSDMMLQAQRFVGLLGAIYQPNGFNLGMNLGECAGAGIAQHVHLHVLPRWIGDSNFMTTVGETRVHPQSLEETLRSLREALHPTS